jgi:peptidoglycan/LPS O-acetylase OafA/YrhL
MTTNQKPQNPRLDFIDALRGLAALYVVGFHMTLIPDFKMPVPSLIKPIVMNGWNGVTLFFVISAFTLCYTLHGKTGDKNSTLFFYIRRVFRIIPLYYLWLFVMFAFDWGTSVFAYLWSNKTTLSIYTFFMYNFIPGKQEGIVWASWTLGVEMVFYLSFPFLFKWCNSLRRAVIGLGLSIIVAKIHDVFAQEISGYSIFIGILHQLPVFMLGIVCFFIYDLLRIKPVDKIWGAAMLIVASLGFIILPYTEIGSFVPMLYIMAVIFGLLLIGLYIFPVKLLIWKPALFLGLISYSLYLNHPKLIYYSGEFYRYIYSFGCNIYLSFFACLSATLLMLSTISYITYFLIEKPGMNLGRFFIKFIKEKSLTRRLKGTFS